MRTRTIVLVIAILLVAGFAALNWTEIVRPTPLSFGLVVVQAPLGLILLGLLALTLVLFLAASAAMRTQSLMDYRQHQKTLEAQRDLADKAEASRFTELRQHLDDRLKELRERDAIAATEFDRSLLQGRREMQSQLDQMSRMISARLGELEQRLDGRAGRGGSDNAVVEMPVQDVVPATPPRTEPTLLSDENDPTREERRQERTADKPAESGWRKWF